MGCPVIIHNKPSTRKYWNFRGRKGFNIGPALNHYRCFHLSDAVTKSLLFSDTVEFMRNYLSHPTFREINRTFHALNFISCAVKCAPATICHEKLMAITKLRELFTNWDPRSMPLLSARLYPEHPPPIPQPTPLTTAMLPPRVVPLPVASPPAHVPPPPRVVTPLATILNVLANQKLSLANLHPPIPSAPMLRQYSRVRHPSPAVPTTGEPPTPISHCTCSLLKVSPLASSSRTFPSKFLQGWAASEVLHGN